MTKQVSPDPVAWTVLESRILHSDDWLTVRTDRCLTPWGLEIPAYHVLELPDWVAVCGLTEAHELVMIREHRHGIGRVMLGLPGGRVDAEETGDTEIPARREFAEETGFGGGRWFKTQRVYSSPGLSTNQGTTYLALGVAPVGAQKLDPSEAIAVVTRPFDRVIADLATGAEQFGSHEATAILAAAATLLTLPDPTLRPLARRLIRAWRKP